MASAITNSKSLTQLVGEGICMAYGTATLTDATAEDIETGLSSVDAAFISIVTFAGTVGTGRTLSYLTGADLGKIRVTADGASGTTTIRWMAIGIGQR